MNKPIEYDLLDIGMFLGYPGCCIVDHMVRVEMLQRGHPIDISDRKLSGTGFVPCPACDTAKSEAQLLDEIRINRISSTPFPNHQMDFENDPEFIDMLTVPY